MTPNNSAPTAFVPASPQAFATYLLIAWLTSNIIFAQIVNILSALEWEVRTISQHRVSITPTRHTLNCLHCAR